MDKEANTRAYAPVGKDFRALLYAVSAFAELEEAVEEGDERALFQAVRSHDLYVDGVASDVVHHAFEALDFPHADEVAPMVTRLEGGINGGACTTACVVGTDVEPGTYQVDNFGLGLFTDAYWEVTASDGGIISNDFLTSAQSVTVTIPAHAGQFSERGFGTGFWVRVG
ncbi:hypothetical protein [Nocardiopsis sp. NPDC006938]|uniref:hypothetical protein n=1 Tax=Nocardiopsis sp. NPDC006938 TaxID=3364337 RepID=UPI00369BD051